MEESTLHHLRADGVTEDVFASARKPNRFHHSHCQPTSHLKRICLVKPTLGGEGWRLTSSEPLARPNQAPTSFLDILCLWGNTWLWEHLQVTGGESWIHDSIADDSLVAVTDGSYIREIYPNLCSAAFVMECSKGRGRIVGSLSEVLSAANAYRGELLGLMAIHLILLSVNKLHRNLSGSVEVVSDCLGALKRVTNLPPYRIPSRCRHSDILKTILVHCRELSFTTHYSHIKAHQDDNTTFAQLSRKAQLNCICDHAAKQRIAMDGAEGPVLSRMFPLEPIGLFVEGEKMTSETGSQIRFWAHHQLAREYYRDQKILSHLQFDLVDWSSVHRTLHNLPRLFQVWAAKHVLGIAGTMKFLAHQDDRSPMCPSCKCCVELCAHVGSPEEGRTLAFEQSAQMMEQWLERNKTHLDLQSLLLRYLRGRGAISCYKCTKELDLPHIIQEFAASQDIIGWDGFIMGMVSSKLLPIQSAYLHQCNSSYQAASWISGVITQLLQVTHSQWIY
jgi:hypothetical protein